MADDSQWPPHQSPHDDYAVILPCKPGEFGAFISGLLGKPQTITAAFFGVFEITQNDIENFYHLVKQRIDQQNDATILQFSVRMVFDDDSSVLLDSFDDFVQYNEVRPIASVAAHLSWTLLIRFPSKPAPEKQDIDVSIVCSGRHFIPIFDNPVMIAHRLNSPSTGYISLRIRHTARTWGADIEALLGNHIRTLLKVRSKWNVFLTTHHEKIGAIAGPLILFAALGGGIIAMKEVLRLSSPGCQNQARRSTNRSRTYCGRWPRVRGPALRFTSFRICS